MLDTVLGWPPFTGLLSLSAWQLIGVTLALTHISIVSITLFLHRHQAHRALDLHPIVSHFFRFWLWFTTSMITKEWVAVHRKHHAKCETPLDPHSPKFKGISTVMWQGAELYRKEAKTPATLVDYGHATPDDWLENNLYSRFNNLGIGLMLTVNVVLFGPIGLSIWAVQMAWTPFWAAGVINGLGHWWGYRNYESPDISRNLIPFGFLIGGEEMHNNHHAFPSSARFSNKWWEFDVGWMYIRLLAFLGLAKVKKVAPKPPLVADKETADMDTLRAVVLNRLHVMSNFGRDVMLPVLKEELQRADDSCRMVLKKARRLLIRETSQMDELSRNKLDRVLASSTALTTVFQYRQSLQGIWNRTAASHESLLEALQEWCAQAEATGIQSLEEFARRLRGYSPAPV